MWRSTLGISKRKDNTIYPSHCVLGPYVTHRGQMRRLLRMDDLRKLQYSTRSPFLCTKKNVSSYFSSTVTNLLTFHHHRVPNNV